MVIKGHTIHGTIFAFSVITTLTLYCVFVYLCVGASVICICMGV